MNIHKFESKHMQDLIDMHKSQEHPNIKAITKANIPRVGYIVYDDFNTPVCAGFLRRIEGKYAQIDTLVTNSQCSSSLRHDGLEVLIKAIINEAKSRKIKGLISTTTDTGTLMRAIRVGFSKAPHTVITLSLE